MAKPGIRSFVLQRYWRVTRGLTMGAQGVVIDDNTRVLLVRHTYRPGWHFPGGGVERNETVEFALKRELGEEAGVEIDGTPELFGLYANFAYFKSDHIALFLVRTWHRSRVPEPNWEIAEQRFFGIDELPNDIHAATGRRIGEIFKGHTKNSMW